MKFKKIILPFDVHQPILSLGTDFKNRLCFAYGRFAFLSEELGNLSQIENFNVFEKIVASMLKRFKVRPRILAYDLHPDYQATRYIKEISNFHCQLRAVQHHHAHLCSCMVENKFKNQNVIGVAFDGTGFGEDQRFWGGEFFIANYKSFRRAAHLRYLPLPGAERAILEPWRLAAAWLYIIYRDKFARVKIDFIEGIDKYKWAILKKMLDSNFNSPLSSSMGRLFDAASCLIRRDFKIKNQAQAAIELENLAAGFKSHHSGLPYHFEIKKQNDKYIIDPKLIFKEIVSGLKNKKPKEEIAFRFHLTVAQIIVRVCLRLRKDTNIKKVILSGGVFQNKILLNLVLDLLYRHKFKVYFHKALSSSDSSIALGQMAVANFKR